MVKRWGYFLIGVLCAVAAISSCARAVDVETVGAWHGGQPTLVDGRLPSEAGVYAGPARAFARMAASDSDSVTVDTLAAGAGTVPNPPITPTGWDGPGMWRVFGNGFVGSLPSDGSIAVSQGYVVAAVNQQVGVYTRAGVLLKLFPFSELFGYDPTTEWFAGTDPRVLYDPTANRWIAVATSFDQPLTVSASATENPAGLWYNWKVYPDSVEGDVWTDFPRIGVAAGSLWIIGDYENYASPSLKIGSTVVVMSLTDLYAGTTLPYTSLYIDASNKGQGLFPARDGLAARVGYALSTSGNSQLHIWALGGTAASPRVVRKATINPLQSDWGATRWFPSPQPGTVVSLTSYPSPTVQSVSTYAGKVHFVWTYGVKNRASILGKPGPRPLTVADTIAMACATGIVDTVTKALSNIKVHFAEGWWLSYPSVSAGSRGVFLTCYAVNRSSYMRTFTRYAQTPADTNWTGWSVPVVSDRAFNYAYDPAGEPVTTRWGDYTETTTAPDGSVWCVSDYIIAGTHSSAAPSEWQSRVTQIIGPTGQGATRQYQPFRAPKRSVVYGP